MLAEPPAAPIGKSDPAAALAVPQTIPLMSAWIRWIRRRTYDAARGVEATLSLARGGEVVNDNRLPGSGYHPPTYLEVQYNDK